MDLHAPKGVEAPSAWISRKIWITAVSRRIFQLAQHVDGGPGILDAADFIDELLQGDNLLRRQRATTPGKQCDDLIGGQVLNSDRAGHGIPFMSMDFCRIGRLHE